MKSLANLDINQLAKRFYKTPEWIALRDKVMQTKNTGRCVNCAVKFSFEHWCEPVVDHILPLKTHPELALNIDNLQILCNGCNYEKGSKIGRYAQEVLNDRKSKRRRKLIEQNKRLELSYITDPNIEVYDFEKARQDILSQIERNSKPKPYKKIKSNNKHNKANRKKQNKQAKAFKNHNPGTEITPSRSSQYLPKHLKGYAQNDYDDVYHVYRLNT